MCLGDGEKLPPSTDDVIVVPTGFDMAKDREAGLAIFFMSYIRLFASLM